MNVIGDSFLPHSGFVPNMRKSSTSVRRTGFASSEKPPFRERALLRIMYTPVASTMPMTQGLSPRRTACTYLFLKKVLSSAVTSRTMTKEGRTTASVASSAPGSPA